MDIESFTPLEAFPPEELLRTLLLQALYTICSERLLVELPRAVSLIHSG